MICCFTDTHVKKISWSDRSFCRARSWVKVLRIFHFIVQPHREKQQLLLFFVPFGLAPSCVHDVCLRDLVSSSSNSKMVEWRRSQTVLMLDAPGGVFTCAFPLCLHWGPEASDCICQLYIPVWCSQATRLHCQSRLIPPLALCCRCFCCRGFFFFFSWQFPLFFPFFLRILTGQVSAHF